VVGPRAVWLLVRLGGEDTAAGPFGRGARHRKVTKRGGRNVEGADPPKKKGDSDITNE